MKVLTIEVGAAACVVRATIALTRTERKTMGCPTEQLVVFGVVLIPERGKRARRFEWRSSLGRLPAAVASALSGVADDYLDKALLADLEDVTGHLERVYRTGMLPVPTPGAERDPAEWDVVDIREIAAVGSGLLQHCLVDRARAWHQVNEGTYEQPKKAKRPQLRLVKG